MLAIIFGGRISSKYPQNKKIQLIKRTNWNLPHIVQETQISGAPTFYTKANKSGKADYKSENVSKLHLSFYDSVQNQNYMLYS